MNIPQKGPNAAKAQFFSEVAQAFDFLAAFHRLSAAQQETLMQTINKMLAQVPR